MGFNCICCITVEHDVTALFEGVLTGTSLGLNLKLVVVSWLNNRITVLRLAHANVLDTYGIGLLNWTSPLKSFLELLRSHVVLFLGANEHDRYLVVIMKLRR